jgi:hypothetical protein
MDPAAGQELTLPELIRRQMDTLGLSLDDVAQQTAAVGHTWAAATMSRLLNTGRIGRAPSREMLESLSIVLDVPLVVLQRATERMLGWDVTPVALDDDEQILIVHRREMRPSERRLVDEMIQAIRRQRRDRNSA